MKCYLDATLLFLHLGVNFSFLRVLGTLYEFLQCPIMYLWNDFCTAVDLKSMK